MMSFCEVKFYISINYLKKEKVTSINSVDNVIVIGLLNNCLFKSFTKKIMDTRASSLLLTVFIILFEHEK